jgi:hypothetical protein
MRGETFGRGALLEVSERFALTAPGNKIARAVCDRRIGWGAIGTNKTKRDDKRRLGLLPAFRAVRFFRESAYA